MKEQVRAHQHVEMGRRPGITEFYSTDTNTGNIWGEELATTQAGSVLQRRRLGLELTSLAISFAANSIRTYSLVELMCSVKQRKPLRFAGALVLIGASSALSKWRAGIDEMVVETIDKQDVFRAKQANADDI